MLVEVFLARETFLGSPFAASDRAEKRVFGSAMETVDFSLMAQKAARIGEALELHTFRSETAVRSVMLVHVLVPFALPVEGLFLALSTDVLSIAINWRHFSWRPTRIGSARWGRRLVFQIRGYKVSVGAGMI